MSKLKASMLVEIEYDVDFTDYDDVKNLKHAAAIDQGSWTMLPYDLLNWVTDQEQSGDTSAKITVKVEPVKE